MDVTMIELQKEKNSLKLKVVLGTAGIVALVILSFLFYVQAGIIVLLLGTAYTGHVWVSAYGKFQQFKRDSRQSEAETLILEHQATREQWVAVRQEREAAIIETRTGVFVFGSMSDWTHVPATANERKQQGLLAAPVADDSPVVYDFVSAIRNANAGIAVIGAQQCSKTNSVMASAYQHFVAGGPVIYISYRYEPAYLWSGIEAYCESQALAGLKRVMGLYVANRRARGQGQDIPQMTLVILDDWINLVALDKGLAARFLQEAATQFVYARLMPIFVLQSDTIADWGLPSGAQLKNNFLKIEIPDPVRDKNLKVLSYADSGSLYLPGNRDKAYTVSLPGKFEVSPSNRLTLEPGSELEPELNPDTVFLELVKGGESKNKASKEAYGKPYSGTTHVERCQQLLTQN